VCNRLAALGAGGELREFERARVMAWSLPRARERAGRAGRRERGERTRIVGQGELVRERAWPAGEPFVAMTGGGRGLVLGAALFRHVDAVVGRDRRG
jgi:hypothetical protein